jgi:competence protein ComEC
VPIRTPGAPRPRSPIPPVPPAHLTSPGEGPVAGRRLMALAIAFAAGIAAAIGGGALLPAAVALASCALWPTARAPRGARDAASAGPGRSHARAIGTLLLTAGFVLGLGLAAAAVRLAPGRRALAGWESAGFEPHKSPILLAGWIEDLEPSGADRVALQCVVEAAAFPSGGNLEPLAWPLRVRLNVPGNTGHPWEPGARFETIARLGPPRRYGNPGSFDYPAWLRARGIELTGSVKSARLVRMSGAAVPPWRGLLARLRAGLVARLATPVEGGHSETAAFLAALLVGERQALGPDLEESLQAAGVYHVVALSGFNVACVAGFASLLLALLPIGPTGRRFALLFVVASYGALARPSGSIARATLMVLAHGAGRVSGRRASPLGTLAVSAMLLLAHRPAWLLDPGFQLSYVATLGLLAVPLPPRRPGRRGSVLRRAAGALAWSLLTAGLASLAAIVATAPLAARHFHRLSAAGLAANLVAVPASAACLFIGFAVLAASMLAPSLVAALTTVASWLLLAIRRTAEACVAVPGGSLWVVPPAWSHTLLLLGALSVARGARRPLLRAFMAAASLGLAIAAVSGGRGDPPAHSANGPPTLEITLLDVGQGDAILVRTPLGATMLIDAGGLGGSDFDVGARVVGPALRTLGVLRLDILALTHAHRDHVGGAGSILEQFRPRAVWLGAMPAEDPAVARFEAAAERLGIAVVRPRRGVAMHLGGARFEVTHPAAGGTPRPNDQSLVLRVRYGRQAALLTGDIEEGVEGDLLASGMPLAAGLLKVAHHGSDTSTAAGFLRAVSPVLALISAGAGNPWGHPAEAVLARLRTAGVRIGRTDRDGALRARTDGCAPWVVDRLAPPPWEGESSADPWALRHEAQEEDEQADKGDDQTSRAERRHVVDRPRVADADDREQDREHDEVVPLPPIPDEAQRRDSREGYQSMGPRREGVEDVTTVELADRQEVERRSEQPEPGGDEERMEHHVASGGKEQRIHQAGEKTGREHQDTFSRRRVRHVRVPEAVDQDRQGGDETGDRSRHPHVEQRPPVGERSPDADDRPEGAEGVGSWKEEGGGGVDAVQAAGHVVPHLVHSEDEEHRGRIGKPVEPGRRLEREGAEEGERPGCVLRQRRPRNRCGIERCEKEEEPGPGRKGAAPRPSGPATRILGGAWFQRHSGGWRRIAGARGSFQTI